MGSYDHLGVQWSLLDPMIIVGSADHLLIQWPVRCGIQWSPWDPMTTAGPVIIVRSSDCLMIQWSLLDKAIILGSRDFYAIQWPAWDRMILAGSCDLKLKFVYFPYLTITKEHSKTWSHYKLNKIIIINKMHNRNCHITHRIIHTMNYCHNNLIFRSRGKVNYLRMS